MDKSETNFLRGEKPNGVKRVLIIGAGPVGLYTALKFFKGNYFSKTSQKTEGLRITVVEKRGSIACDGQDIFKDPLQLSYKELLNENKSLLEFHSLKEFISLKNCKIAEKWWAIRRQVFYITRENLETFDPIVRKLLRTVSCGSSTSPGKWGFLKCITDSSLSNYKNVHPDIIMGDEYPSMKFKDPTDYDSHGFKDYKRIIERQPSEFSYFNRMPEKFHPSQHKKGKIDGSLTIEAGMLQRILIYAIKVEERRQLDIAASFHPQPTCGWIPYYTNNDPDYKNELDPNYIQGFMTACKKFEILYNTNIVKDLGKHTNSGEFDMIFNCSGFQKVDFIETEVASVCYNNPPVSTNVEALRPDLNEENCFDCFGLRDNGSNLDDGEGICKQWGSIMEIEFGHDNNTSDQMLVDMMRIIGTSSEGVGWTDEQIAHNIGKSGVEDYFLKTNKNFDQRVASLNLPESVGDYDKPTHDLRIFPSRGEGHETKTGRLYIGVLLSVKENDALCAVYGRPRQKDMPPCTGGSKKKLSFTHNAKDNSNELVINGIIIKYAILAHTRGVPWNTVDWVGSDFSWFPMTLRKVKEGFAAIETPKTLFVNIGDAAYSAHYFSGMGVNNGFKAVNFFLGQLGNQIGDLKDTYNIYTENAAIEYRDEVRKEFQSPRIIKGLYGLQNSYFTRAKDLNSFLRMLDTLTLPQQEPQKIIHSLQDQKYWEQQTNNYQNFSQSNPQIRQLNSRKAPLRHLQSTVHNDKTLFEIYLYYLEHKMDLNATLKAALLEPHTSVVPISTYGRHSKPTHAQGELADAEEVQEYYAKQKGPQYYQQWKIEKKHNEERDMREREQAEKDRRAREKRRREKAERERAKDKASEEFTAKKIRERNEYNCVKGRIGEGGSECWKRKQKKRAEKNILINDNTRPIRNHQGQIEGWQATIIASDIEFGDLKDELSEWYLQVPGMKEKVYERQEFGRKVQTKLIHIILDDPKLRKHNKTKFETAEDAYDSKKKVMDYLPQHISRLVDLRDEVKLQRKRTERYEREKRERKAREAQREEEHRKGEEREREEWMRRRGKGGRKSKKGRRKSKKGRTRTTGKSGKGKIGKGKVGKRKTSKRTSSKRKGGRRRKKILEAEQRAGRQEKSKTRKREKRKGYKV